MSQFENPQEQYQQSQPKPKQIEAMKNPWFHIWKIDTNTLSTLSEYWLKIQNGSDNNWNGVVILNGDRKLRVFSSKDWTFKDREFEWGVLNITNGTKKISTYTLKQDGFDNPNAPLRIMSENKDWTTDYVILEKRGWKNTLSEIPTDVKEALKLVNCDVNGKYIVPRNWQMRLPMWDETTNISVVKAEMEKRLDWNSTVTLKVDNKDWTIQFLTFEKNGSGTLKISAEKAGVRRDLLITETWR